MIVFLVLAIGASQAKLRIDNQWTGGFQGAIEIPIQNSINGWKLEIRFSQPVSIDVYLFSL